VHDTIKLRKLHAELLLARTGQPVISSPPVIFRRPPFTDDPTFNQHSLQRGIERAFLDFKNVVRVLLNAQRNALAVHRATFEGFENHHVKRAWWNFGARHEPSPPIDKLSDCATLMEGCQSSGAYLRNILVLDATADVAAALRPAGVEMPSSGTPAPLFQATMVE
jgi:hypothetical protein